MNPHLKLAYEHGVRKALEEAGITKTSSETPDWMRAGPMVGALTAGALLHPGIRAAAGKFVAEAAPKAGVSLKALRSAAPKIMKGVGVIGAGTTIGWLPQLMYEGMDASF